MALMNVDLNRHHICSTEPSWLVSSILLFNSCLKLFIVCMDRSLGFVIKLRRILLLIYCFLYVFFDSWIEDIIML